MRQGYLRQEGLRYPILAITDVGREVMHDRVQARLGSWEPTTSRRSRKEPADRTLATRPLPGRGRRAAAGLTRMADTQIEGAGSSAVYHLLGPHAG